MPYRTESYTSDGSDTADWEWTSARLQNVAHTLYIYGLYISEDNYFTAIDIYRYTDGGWDNRIDLEYEPSDGLRYPNTITTDNIGSDGSFRIRLATGAPSALVYFDYLLLVPRSVPGKINLNTAWVDVLAGLPGISVAEAQDIYDCVHDVAGAHYPYYENLGEVLDATGIDADDFYPISNLVSVHSDVFKIICLAQTIHDINGNGAYDSTDIILAEKEVEVIVDRSSLDTASGAIKIISWKEITE